MTPLGNAAGGAGGTAGHPSRAAPPVPADTVPGTTRGPTPPTPCDPGRRDRRGGRDRGTIAPVLPVLGLAILLLGGLVMDAARLLNARAAAIAHAEEAARAGAGAIDLGSDTLELIAEDSRARVEEYCAGILQDTRSEVKTCHLVGIEEVGNGDSRPLVVHVRVTMEIPPTLLGMVGVSTFSATGEGRARPFEGILTPDDIRTGSGDV